MDRRIRKKGERPKRTRRIRPWKTACASLMAFAVLLPATVRAARAEANAPLAVSFPKSVHQGEALKIRITFPKPPPDREFYRLEVDVDSHPVALADLSEESSTWITVPAQAAGVHVVTVVWRNPPGGATEVQARTVKILP